MRIGLFGGTFDPFHNGHLGVAIHARDHLPLDLVLLLPVGQHPLRANPLMLDYPTRRMLIEKSVAGLPGIEVSDLDGDGSGYNYTIDLVNRVRAVCPEDDLWFLMGADNLASLKEWKDYRKLLDLIHFTALTRNVDTPGVDPDIRSKITFLDMPPIDVSSTEIRSRLAAGVSIDDLVPRAVADYFASTLRLDGRFSRG